MINQWPNHFPAQPLVISSRSHAAKAYGAVQGQWSNGGAGSPLSRRTNLVLDDRRLVRCHEKTLTIVYHRNLPGHRLP